MSGTPTPHSLGKIVRGFERGRRPTIKPRIARVLGVFSCKGGVGKTTTVANIGSLLADKLGEGVLVVEANLSAPNLGLHLGLVDPEPTIHDVLVGAVPVEKAIHVVEKIHVIPGSLGYEGDIPLIDFKESIEPLRSKYRLIIIDSAPGLGMEAISAIKASNMMLIVTNPEIPTIASTLRAFRAAERYRVPVLGAVLNKVSGKKYEVPISEVKKSLGWPILSTVPEDDKVRESLTAGTPVVKYAPKSSAARAFSELAERIHEKLFGELSQS
ncbi:MAG: AAA family ATPase [Candidatus Hadarchaeales archaeon]